MDGHDTVIAQRTRAEVHAQGLFHRAVHIVVTRPDGAVLMQQRSMQKDTSPGKWTTSCSGHVDAGENYEAAAIRELSEEIGVFLSKAETLREIGRHDPCPQTGQEFIRIYHLCTEQVPEGHPQEVEQLAWMRQEEVERLLVEQAETCSPAFSLVWEVAQAVLAK